MNEEEPAEFYPMFLSMLSNIRKMREDDKSWEDIENKIVGDLIESKGKQYYIFYGKKCGYPSGCDNTAKIVFIYKEGMVEACEDHAQVEKFVKFMKES